MNETALTRAKVIRTDAPGTYWLETYGCQMNMAESFALEAGLKELGYTPASSAKEADIVVLNTCSVRKTAEDRIFGRLGLFASLKKKSNIFACLLLAAWRNV